MKKPHILAETDYCSTMFETTAVDRRLNNGRPRCTSAGRYMDTGGRVICARCAAGRVVVKLTDAPKLIDLVDQIAASKDPLTDDLRSQLRALVAVAPEDSP